MKNLRYIIYGILFGIILTKAEVINWFRIRNMFLFREAHMYLIIGSAVLTGMLGVFLLKKLNLHSIGNKPIDFSQKPYHKGFIIGGFVFGIGWAITGACPGPIFAQIGTGAWPALFTLAGALCGAYLYHALKSRLPH